jgi:cytochrome c-type biogenesis protein
MFAIGHCAVIVLAGASAEAVQQYLHWNERSGAGKVFRMVCGLIVVLAGLGLLWSSVHEVLG